MRIIALGLPEPDVRRVSEVSAEAARCRNDIVGTANDFYSEHRAWMRKGEIQKAVRCGYALHSQTARALTDRFCGNRETAAERGQKAPVSVQGKVACHRSPAFGHGEYVRRLNTLNGYRPGKPAPLVSTWLQAAQNKGKSDSEIPCGGGNHTQ